MSDIYICKLTVNWVDVQGIILINSKHVAINHKLIEYNNYSLC